MSKKLYLKHTTHPSNGEYIVIERANRFSGQISELVSIWCKFLLDGTLKDIKICEWYSRILILNFFFFFVLFFVLFCLINLYGWFVSFFEISFSIKKKKCFSQEEISLESYTSNITSANNFLATGIVSWIQFCVIFARLMFFILIVFSYKHNLT